MSSDQEQFRALIEKHKAADQPKTFFFKDKYYKLKRDEFNVMNWCVLPMSVEQYNSEMTGIPLNLTTVPPDSSVSS
jgi:hypothetical protein